MPGYEDITRLNDWVKLRIVSGDVVEGEIEVLLVENYLTVL
jgi:hypothetical protein